MNIAGISRKQRRVIIYDEFRYYDGKDYHETTKEEIKKWSFLNSFKSKYIPIKKDDDKTFEQCFTEFVEKANTLRTLSLIDGKNASTFIKRDLIHKQQRRCFMIIVIVKKSNLIRLLL